MRKGSTTKKSSRETIRKRIATRRRNAAIRNKMREDRLNNPTLGKEALKVAAIDRLARDGAHSTEALQRRVMVLAAERSIQPADFHKLMFKRISVRDIGLFCEKHKVSYDWLLRGDLRGLQRMTNERRARRLMTATVVETEA